MVYIFTAYFYIDVLYIDIYYKYIFLHRYTFTHTHIYYILNPFWFTYNNQYNVNAMQIVAIMHCLGKSDINSLNELTLTHLIFQIF